MSRRYGGYTVTESNHRAACRYCGWWSRGRKLAFLARWEATLHEVTTHRRQQRRGQ